MFKWIECLRNLLSCLSLLETQAGKGLQGEGFGCCKKERLQKVFLMELVSQLHLNPVRDAV